VLALVRAVLFRRDGAMDRGPAGALAIGAATAYVRHLLNTARALPPINDITTDTERPPQSRNRCPNGGGSRRAAAQAYPDLQPGGPRPQAPRSPSRARSPAQADGWEIVDAQPGGRIGPRRHLLVRLQDDVVVRITPLAAGSRIDVRSKSRVGRGDAA